MAGGETEDLPPADCPHAVFANQLQEMSAR